MATQEVKRKLTAILSADVKGYSRLMGKDEVAKDRVIDLRQSRRLDKTCGPSKGLENQNPIVNINHLSPDII